MNSILIFLLLISLSIIVWHINTIKKEKQTHLILVFDLEKDIAFQTNKSKVIKSKSDNNVYESIHFKLDILKQQATLLNEISKLKE
ncbi:hypothetical protein GOQ30_09020 [Flavobacterium sp. TP390]|uniref:Uncharacterized protein n=1 Tax=Flavobacterium profundi TaxID=1774945 RepID=A0A6I4ISM3_9FLAO|nr:hypothetical protein [Flavobacterium profundi]MVO09297.1 hypothetical protein [Flavobacterium profundi]